MRVPGLVAILALVFAAVASAEPLVVGFERFHAATPDAAGGRLLYNELGCANCHGGDTGLPRRTGPDLSNVVDRVKAAWLTGFLANPQAARAGTNMPHLVNREEAEALLHYLGTMKGKKPDFKMRPQVNAERGSAIYHQIGCVACHAPTGDFQPADGKPDPGLNEYPPVAFPDLRAKYDLHSLAAFLQTPLAHRPDGRMPEFELDDEAAGDLAAHLMDFQDSNGKEAPRIARFAVDPALARKGAELFASRRCASCHELSPKKVPAPIAITILDAGCLSANPGRAAPRYQLAPRQSQALMAYLRDNPDAHANASAPADVAALTLEALNCAACHDRDGRGGPDAGRQAYFTGDPSLGDSGRYPPPLTQAGAKLQTDWLTNVLAGTAPRMRPYLHTRMPVFGDATRGLAELLAETDRREFPPLAKGDVDAGRKLLGALGGVNCVTCHRWADRPSLGIQALDISNMAERLQAGWLQAYLLDPASYRPGTLMPPLWPGGVATNREILGGDTGRQIASIIAFSRDGEGVPEGYPAFHKGEFELQPVEHPIVLRTFLADVGPRAILVGFPEGVHLAYDGKSSRPALVWRGRFFDAYNTWFSRSAPFESPLEQEIIEWPAPAGDDRRFKGYRLDAERVPTFLFQAGDVLVEERIAPLANGLERILIWDGSKRDAIEVAHPAGMETTIVDSAPGRLTIHYTWK